MFPKFHAQMQELLNAGASPFLLESELVHVRLERPVPYRQNWDTKGVKLLYLLSGHATLQIATEVIPLKAHELCFVDLNSVYMILECSEDCVWAIITLALDTLRFSLMGRLYTLDQISSFLYSAINQDRKNSFYIVFHVSENLRIQLLLTYFLEEALTVDAFFQDMYLALICALMVELNREMLLSPNAIQSSKTSHKHLFEILTFISQNFSTVTLKMLSQHFGYTPNYISTVLKNNFGRSFQQIKNEMRCIEAGKLLATTEMPITAISSAVGYTGSSHFYTVFFRYYGIEPSQYRKLAQAGQQLPELHLQLQKN